MSGIKRLTAQYHWIWAVLGAFAMWIAVGVISGNFNFTSLVANFTSASFLTIAALGQMIVMTTGRGAIDLSIPNMITLSAFLTMGMIDGHNERFVPVLLVVLLAGMAVGLCNSILVVCMRITPMVATLAMGYIVSSIISLYNRGYNAMKVCDILMGLTRKRLLGVPLVCFVVMLITGAVWLLFHSVTYGKALLALGQNKKAAALAGIRVNRVEIIAYIMSAALASVTGFLLSARVGGAFLGMGDTYMLDTVGSVVIGGTLASGGRAVPGGTLFGALFLCLAVTAMQVANFSVGMQNIVKGALIILVLVLSTGNNNNN